MSSEGFDRNPPPTRRHTVSIPYDREEEKSEIELVEKAKSVEVLRKQSTDLDLQSQEPKFWKVINDDKPQPDETKESSLIS